MQDAVLNHHDIVPALGTVGLRNTFQGVHQVRRRIQQHASNLREIFGGVAFVAGLIIEECVPGGERILNGIGSVIDVVDSCISEVQFQCMTIKGTISFMIRPNAHGPGY